MPQTPHPRRTAVYLTEGSRFISPKSGIWVFESPSGSHYNTGLTWYMAPNPIEHHLAHE